MIVSFKNSIVCCSRIALTIPRAAILKLLFFKQCPSRCAPPGGSGVPQMAALSRVGVEWRPSWWTVTPGGCRPSRWPPTPPAPCSSTPAVTTLRCSWPRCASPSVGLDSFRVSGRRLPSQGSLPLGGRGRRAQGPAPLSAVQPGRRYGRGRGSGARWPPPRRAARPTHAAVGLIPNDFRLFF